MEASLRKIHLGGDLGEKYGKEHEFVIASVGEFVRAMEANYPGFRNDIRQKGEYNICVGDKLVEEYEDLETSEQLNEDTVGMSFSKGDFYISPAIGGSASKGWFQIVLGAILIIVAYYVGGPVGGYMMTMGVGIMLMGVSTLLSPTPATPDPGDFDRPDKNKSFLFNGPVNTMDQGGAVPLLYGNFKKGSTVLTASLIAEDI